MSPSEVIVIAGPTASGKSELSIELAKAIEGQVVSADSMQIYKGMDIGTAKVPESRREVRHYGIDIADPGEPYSAALFQEYARDSFKEIQESGHAPILCGGTGFYIRAAIDQYEFPKGDQVGNPVRETYQKLLDDEGPQALWEALDKVDPESAGIIHPNNSKRVIRAFELLDAGTSYARQSENLCSIKQAIPAVMFCIEVSRDTLNRRIEDRVDSMIRSGLVDEVRKLADSGFKDAVTSPQAIGYKEVAAALEGRCTMDEAVEQIKTATRRYAKRQRSWFRADKRYHIIDGEDGDVQGMLEQVLDILDCNSRASS